MMVAHFGRLARFIQQPQLMANRILVREPGAGGIFIDHRDARRILVVGRCEIAPPQQRNARGLEIARSDVELPHVPGVLELLRLRLALEDEGADPDVPVAGSEVVAPALSTPGKVASLGISCSKKRADVSLSGNCASGKPTRKVNVRDGSIPMSVFCRCMKLRIISPAPIKRTRASATSATTSELRTRWPFTPPAPARPPSLRTSTSCGFEAWSAGNNPKRTLETAPIPSAKRKPAIEIEVDPVRHLVRKRGQHQIHAPDGEDQTERAAGQSQAPCFP